MSKCSASLNCNCGGFPGASGEGSVANARYCGSSLVSGSNMPAQTTFPESRRHFWYDSSSVVAYLPLTASHASHRRCRSSIRSRIEVSGGPLYDTRQALSMSRYRRCSERWMMSRKRRQTCVVLRGPRIDAAFISRVKQAQSAISLGVLPHSFDHKRETYN